MGKRGQTMASLRARDLVALGLVLAALAYPLRVSGMPNPPPIRFIDPTPADKAIVTANTVSIRVDAACTFDPASLAVTLNGSAIAASQFLPFSACSNGRITSQTAVVGITLPTGSAITSAPSNLTAGTAGTFTASGGGDGFSWNFDGGAAPASGATVSATFKPQGTFTVRVRTTRSQNLAASGLSSGGLVTGQRTFNAGDPTPATQALTVVVPPDIDFANFEAGHVRPLALSPNGAHLFAVNTPDDRLEVFAVGAGSLTRLGDVQVGLQPVAVAARSDTEVWVVNHLSDSVSVVDTSDPSHPRVTATLLVGDEPRDLVFGRADKSRAFITTAHRGQNRPTDPQLTTPGVGRADVWVFNATNLAAAPTILTFFADTPRALAVTPDGSRVYAAAFHSGNQTTSILQPVVSANGGVPPFPPGSAANPPATGLIVKFNPATNRWEDERGASGPDWSPFVPFSLPDEDVFLIDATAEPPAPAAAPNFVTSAGTIIFNMAVRPGPNGGSVFVANTNARNNVRFEPLINANLGVQGHIAESRITVINGTTATPVHLNPHIDYSVPTGPSTEIDQSLAFPMDMVFSSNGQTLYVVAFGSGKVGVLDAGDLETGVVTEDQIAVGGGPSGLALDEANDQLFVMNRIDGTISIVTNASDPAQRAATATVPLRFDPSPFASSAGRHFLYDARNSGHGDSACASCHIFGDFDSLAWDLGDPFGTPLNNPNPFRVGGPGSPFHPLKGPMTTQSLRGLAGAGPMHWRGDRTGGNDPGGDPLDEDAAFKKFNPAFVSLLGSAAPLSDTDLQSFTDFILTLRYPPNPVRALTNVATTAQTSGLNFFNNTPTDGANTCQFCHRLPFGTDGFSSVEGEPQQFKIPHLRNAYQKVGMFGVPPGANGGTGGGTGNLGPQVRGFGFLHDGSVATLFNFHQAQVFSNLTNALRRNLEAFILAFDTGLRPIVGQEETFNAATKTSAAVVNRVNLLVSQAQAGACDLIAKGVVGGIEKGFLFDPTSNTFQPDDSTSPLNESALRGSLAGADVLTYIAVPPGSGNRMGIDRDRDGWPDGVEELLGTDPADPHKNPWQF